MPNSHSGLLPVADRWSMVGLIGGPTIGLSLIVANIATAATGNAVFLAGPLHTLAAATVIMLTICSLVVQLATRIIRGQRRILAALDETDEDDGYAAGYADGLAASAARGNGSRVAQMPPRGSIRS